MVMSMSEIYKEELANGITARVTDKSRQVAGDRWYIKLVCTVILPVAEGMVKVRDDDGPELLTMVRTRLGSEAMKEFVQERNFVDEQEKDEVLAELLVRTKGNIKGYLASAKFPAPFFDRCCDEARTACLAEINLPTEEQADDDDGPTDFSGCFQD
jgi:hypothetical protein